MQVPDLADTAAMVVIVLIAVAVFAEHSRRDILAALLVVLTILVAFG